MTERTDAETQATQDQKPEANQIKLSVKTGIRAGALSLTKTALGSVAVRGTFYAPAMAQ